MAENTSSIYLQMGLYPQRFVEVTLAQPQQEFAVGEPIVLEAAIHNKGPVPLPVGPNGLFEATMALRASVQGMGEEPVKVTEMPLAIWPAPHYIAPGEVISTKVRLDVGPMEKLLNSAPLDDLAIEVTGVFDPVQREEDLSASLTELALAPVTVTRAGLMSSGKNPDGNFESTYRQAMDALASEIDSENEAVRMRAAAKTGALKILLLRADKGQTQLPQNLPRETMRATLAEHQDKLLADQSPLVKAEMLKSLLSAGIADRAMAATAVSGDQSALVNLRLAEMLGTMGENASQETLSLLSINDNELVAEMAKTFMPQE